MSSKMDNSFSNKSTIDICKSKRSNTHHSSNAVFAQSSTCLLVF